MKTLADEILGVITEIPVALGIIAARLGADTASIRRAAQALNDIGSAVLVRRKRTLHLASAAFQGLACKHCYVEFERAPKSKRQCCCRAHGIAWSWTRPGVKEKRSAGILTQCATPAAKARQAAQNERRWACPGERENLAEQSRARWADPAFAEKCSAAIRAVNGSAEFRKLCSDIRKAYWQEPEARDKMLETIRAGQKTPTARANHSAANRRRYSEPASREKYLEVSRKNIAKATAVITGKKQSPEQIQKRIATRKATMAAKRKSA